MFMLNLRWNIYTILERVSGRVYHGFTIRPPYANTLSKMIFALGEAICPQDEDLAALDEYYRQNTDK
jgi:hypothetical protein